MRRAMRMVAVTLTAMAAIMTTGGAAASDPVVGGPGAHPHHVETGNDGCVDINSVLFQGGDRGLHRGSNSSGAHGPNHGSCA